MKPVQFFLLLSVVIILLQSSCDKQTEPDDNHQKPIVALYPSASIMNLPDSIRSKWDLTKNPLVISSILLPNNCGVSFAVCNIGPKGTVLDYSIVESQGYLVCTPSAGTVVAGQASTISVSMDPRLINNNAWTQLVLEVYTPTASNYTKSLAAIRIENMDDYVSKKLCDSLCGTWSGSWSGTSSASYAGPSASVAGTWSLNLEGFDIIGASGGPVHDSKVYGTLSWEGTDAYWSGLSNILHQNPVNKTIILNSSNTELYIADMSCNLTWSGEFYIVICPSCQNSDHSGYNVDFSLHVSKYNIEWSNSHWSTSFEDSQNNSYSSSSGILSGQKSH